MDQTKSFAKKEIYETLFKKNIFHKQDELSLMFDRISYKSFSESTSYRIVISRVLSSTSVFKK